MATGIKIFSIDLELFPGRCGPRGGSEWVMKWRLSFSDGLDSQLLSISKKNSILIIRLHKMAIGINIFTLDFELFKHESWAWHQLGWV